MSPSQALQATTQESTEDVTNKSKVLDSTEACRDGNSNVVSSPSSGDNSSPFEDDSSSSGDHSSPSGDKNTDAPTSDIASKKRKKEDISSDGDSKELVTPVAKRLKEVKGKPLASKKRKKEDISSAGDSKELVSPVMKRPKFVGEKSPVLSKKECTITKDSNDKSTLEKQASSMEEKIKFTEDNLVEASDDMTNTTPTKIEENCNGDLSKKESKDEMDDNLLKEEKNNVETEEKGLEN